jgi:DNA replication protein DnaC
MTSNRPIEDWGKLLGDVPAASAILDRLLSRADIIPMTGRSHRLAQKISEPKPDQKTSKTQAQNHLPSDA